MDVKLTVLVHALVVVLEVVMQVAKVLAKVVVLVAKDALDAQELVNLIVQEDALTDAMVTVVRHVLLDVLMHAPVVIPNVKDAMVHVVVHAMKRVSLHAAHRVTMDALAHA